MDTKQIKTPDTGVTLIVKSRQSYADYKAIYRTVFGSVTVNSQPQDNVNFEQAQAMVDTTLQRMVIDWDYAVDGVKVPYTFEELENVLTEKDVTYVISALKADETEKK